jgi:hypothetical protein
MGSVTAWSGQPATEDGQAIARIRSAPAWVARTSARQRGATAEVEGFLATPPDRPSTLVRRLDAFEALNGRAALYRDVLQVHVADLNSTLAAMTASVEILLNQKAAA